jgi:hypothetical protein
MTCCDIPAKLHSFPQTWREELSALLCEIVNERQNIDCETVKDCETVTALTAFSLNEDVLSISYRDEKNIVTTRQQSISSIFNNILTFNSGLEKNSNVVQLGGNPLLKNTILNLSGYILDVDGENIRFSDYPSSRTPDTANGTYLFTNTSGKLMTGSLASLIPSTFSAPLTFDNGLTRTTNNIRLGGNLVTPTVIDAVNDAALVTNDLWVKNNTAFGDLRNTTNVVRFLNVHNALPGKQDIHPFYVDKVFTETSPTTDSYGAVIIHSARGAGNLNFTNVYNSALDVRFSYSSNTSNIIGNVNGVISGLTFGTSETLTGGDIDSFTGFRASAPRQSTLSNPSNKTYGGEIDTLYGLYVEDLRNGSEVDPSVVINNTWGVYQEGVNDFNRFYGVTGFGPFGLGDLSAQVNISRTAKHNYKSQSLNSYLLLNQNRGVQPIVDNISTPTHSTIDLSFTGNETFDASSFVSAIDAKVTYSSNTSNVTGKVSSITTDSIFYSGVVSNGGGSFDKLIGVRVTKPLQLQPTLALAAKNYTGTIADTYGILIEQQYGGLAVGAAQTRTWGVYQEGANDVNYFAGKTRITELNIGNTGASVPNAVTASVATASTNKIAININGTTYYLLATTVA